MHAPIPRTEAAPPLDARAIASAWTIEPGLVLALALAALVYARGWRRLRAGRAGRAPAWRLVAFVSGLGALFVALASPLDTFADRSLAVHMAQHLVLLVIVPPLLLAGAPIAPILHSLPAGRARARAGLVAARLGDVVGHPLVCLVAFSLAVWCWHVPAAFELALRSRAWHVAEHATFLAAGLLFWSPVVAPWPTRPHWPRWTMVPYLLVADLQNTALAAILIFSDRILYSTYGTTPDALRDQVTAGLLMWVPMSIAYLVPAATITYRLLSPPTISSRRAIAASTIS
ncbi:MAG TPA: cytochrome c oxidase assembly protein [Candidatus Eisenbacteria bacterium]|nr:cytochrome c oxidase assembly protein [Candidatus Eisenbacteria bacterium]